jgi:hypothetical protein
MSDFLKVMGPVILFWTIPLIPMFYLGLVGTIEWLVKRLRDVGPGTGRPEVQAALAPTD